MIPDAIVAGSAPADMAGLNVRNKGAVIELCDVGGAITLDISRDEFVIDAVVSYSGAPLKFPEQPPAKKEILEAEDGHRRLAGLLIRRDADRITPIQATAGPSSACISSADRRAGDVEANRTNTLGSSWPVTQWSQDCYTRRVGGMPWGRARAFSSGMPGLARAQGKVRRRRFHQLGRGQVRSRSSRRPVDTASSGAPQSSASAP